MDLFTQASELRRVLVPLIEKVVDERTKECLRTYKAKVVTSPNAEVINMCRVQLAGQAGEDNPVTLLLPFSTAVADVEAESYVWVATTNNSWKNAVVWQKIKFD